MTDKTWLPQRWDVGLWDQALWDGQLGFNALQGSITVNPGGDVSFTYGHLLSAQTGSIALAGNPVGLLSGRSFAADTGSIIVDGSNADVAFRVNHVLLCETGQIRVNGEAAGWATFTPFLQPGPLNFGIQRVMIPNRW